MHHPTDRIAHTMAFVQLYKEIKMKHQPWAWIKCIECIFNWNISKISVQLKREREMFYLTTHSTHFIYGYMASDIWLRTILIVRKETRCRHIGYSYRLTARVLSYASYIPQPLLHQSWSTGWNENSSMGPPHEGSIRRPIAPWANVNLEHE